MKHTTALLARGAEAASLVLALAAAGCEGRSSAPPARPAAAGPAVLETVRVVEQPAAVTLEIPGELDPYESVDMYARVTGFVKEIRVDRGSRVSAGQLMAEIDAPELLAQRAEAQSKLQAAEAQLAVARTKADADASTLDRLKGASATPGAVAGNDLVLAQKTEESDQSQIVSAQQTVEAGRQAVHAFSDMESYLKVVAPFDGVVTERNVHPGALVGPGGGQGSAKPMLRVVRIDRLRLTVPVPEAYIASIAPATAVSFTVPAYPGAEFHGTVARLAHAVDVATRTMAIEVDVMNADNRLSPGTFCQVRWPVRRPGPSLFVPGRSVATTTDRTFVIRVRGGRTEWIDVKTGLTSGALVEVFGDLHAGDEIASRGTDEIRPGTEVRANQK
jgi:membrane fusion protein, multidrug efflux system